MICGIFLRHYKIYRGLNFIPISINEENKFSLFIGDNGVGKSSILESLDTFFNKKYWNKTKDTKNDEAFISPIFLIKKSKCLELKMDELIILEKLSEYFWNVDIKTSSMFSSEEYKQFFKYRDYLKENFKEEEYYFFTLAIEYINQNKITIAGFKNDLWTKKFSGEEQNIDFITLFLKKHYSYIYIPVETNTNVFLKLENKEMQELMNTDILEKISSFLNQKVFPTETGQKSNKSLIEVINKNLDEFIDVINETVKDIDSEYSFNVEGRIKKNLTANDVREKILEAYFSIRTLKKNKKEIEELSSGEQRIALIDIATAFLSNSKNTSRNVVLAIDEPETSLHVTKCFGQFKRLEQLAQNTQILTTTHWYGSLPTIEKGTLIHLTKQDKISSKYYSFSNYFENRGTFPEDVSLKSYFELASSIITIMRNTNENWIICEGSDDKKFLEYYLKDTVQKLKVFAVGGCGNIIKLYKYMFLPFEDNSIKKEITGKILCLIDSDKEQKTIDLPNTSSDKKLKIVRMQVNADNKIKLQNLNNIGYYHPTEIEDYLNPEKYYNSIRETIDEVGTEIEKDALDKFLFNENLKKSIIKGEESLLIPTELNFLENKKVIYNFLDLNRNKYLIANKYVKTDKNEATPELFLEIENFFK